MIFKSLKIVLLIFLINTVQTFAQSEQLEIISTMQKNAKDWNTGSIEKYMEIYVNSDSLLFIGKSGPKYGFATTLANYKKAYPDASAMGKLSFEFLKIEVINKESAFVAGTWKLKRAADEPAGHFTLLMKKIKGKWYIVVDHSS